MGQAGESVFSAVGVDLAQDGVELGFGAVLAVLGLR